MNAPIACSDEDEGGSDGGESEGKGRRRTSAASGESGESGGEEGSGEEGEGEASARFDP